MKKSLLKEFLLQRRIKSLSLLCLGFWLIFFPTWWNWPSKHPFEKEINLAQVTTISEPIEIRVTEYYSLTFKFERNKLKQSEAEHLIGTGARSVATGELVDKGIPIPITWKIIDKNTHQIINSGQAVTISTDSYTKDYIYRPIKSFKLQKGNYKLDVRIEAVPEFKNVTTLLELNFGHGKEWSAWQFDVTWWGSLIYPLLVLIAIGLGGNLIFNFLKFKKEKKSLTN